MKTKYYIYLVLSILLFTSCNDYLDIEPKGFTIVNSVKDYDLLLNGGPLTINTTGDENLLFFSADDFVAKTDDLGDISLSDNDNFNSYVWNSNLYKNDNPTASWNTPYANIYTYNKIINELGNLEVKDESYSRADINRILAQAKAGRAYEYWLLVNTFGKQYTTATASSDLGVPLVLEANAAQKTPSRATVKEVYDLIIKDLESAIPFLPLKAQNSVRVSKAAGYAFLARFYLFMQEYEKARYNASKAIGLKGEVSDYVNVNLPHYTAPYVKQQYVMRYFGGTIGFTTGTVNDEVIKLYDDNDTRLTKFLTNCKWIRGPQGWKQDCKAENGYTRKYKIFKVNQAVSVPEMYLIRAECNARLNDGSLANVMSDLDKIRSKRIKSYKSLTTTDIPNKEKALKFTLEERRRELLLSGIRWFDLKRLNLERAFAKTIKHVVGGTEYVLQPNSNKYVIPIPGQIIKFNPEMKQNPRN